MKSNLQYFHFDSDLPADCGEVLNIEFSSASLDWPGVVLEKGSSPHFYPKNVYTPYFYFALALEQDLHWQADTGADIAQLKTLPGDVWVNPPKTPFSHDISETCYFVILAIEERVFLQSCSLDLTGKSLQFLNNYNLQDDTIKGIIELFMVEAKNGGRNGNLFLQNLLSLLATHYVRNYSNYTDLLQDKASTSRLDEHQIARVDSYIDDHLGEPVSIDELAELLGCSKYYFLREFKKQVGVTPYQYLVTRRLAKAKTLLLAPRATIAGVAAALGFNDQSHFTRSFKKEFGITPGQFKKR